MSETLDLREKSPSRQVDRLSTLFGDLEKGETRAVLTEANPRILLVANREETPPAAPKLTFRDCGEGEWTIEILRPEDRADTLPTIDVRNIAPQDRHEILLDTFDALPPEEGFVLLNDHDPKPLSHELRSTRGDIFEWTYRRRKSGDWRVAIEKTADSASSGPEVAATFDLREISSDEAHESIFHRFGMLPDGATMELVADEEPRTLHEAFRRHFGDDMSWEIVYADPDEFRVRVTKQGDQDGTGLGNEASQRDPPELLVREELDVRDRPPAQRHEVIFEAYENLTMGEGFVLVNDHDPKPLYHQFDEEAGDAFHWEYRQRASGEFRVLIGKTDEEDEGGSGERQPDPPI